MATAISIVRTLPAGPWRQFVADNPAGNIFHTPEMFQVFSHTKRFHPEVWAATCGERVLALLLPVRIAVMGGFLSRLTTRSVSFGSVLCAPGTEGLEALAGLLRTYTNEVDTNTLFTELRNLSDLAAVQPTLQAHGFKHEGHLDYHINLRRPMEDIFGSIGRRARKHIRHEIKAGVVVCEEATDRGQLGACYDLLRATYHAARVPLPDCSLFDASFDVLYPKGMVRFTLAHVNHVPAAVSVDLFYKDVVYGWYGGMDRAYSRNRPNEMLTWHLLQLSAERGYGLYDFGGAGKPGEEYGVRDFKAKFGGELVSYGRNICVHSPLRLRLSEMGYHLWRRVFL